MSVPFVSICIPTYNQAAYLQEAVLGAYCQKDVEVRVWLSDDASTDGTPDVVAELTQGFPTLRTFRHSTNLGMSGNPRWIVRQPQTEFIVKLDSDDRLHSEYVTKLVSLLRAHPKAGYAHCSVNQIDKVGTITRVRRLARKTGFQEAEESLRSLTTGYRVAANICLFRREALEAVNFYRDGMTFADDWDLAVRLADAGWGNVYHEDILADYRVWDDADNVRARRKLDEIIGCSFVYKDALTPAFLKRKWGLEPITQARSCSAVGHSAVLCRSIFTVAERKQIIEALRELGGSPALERRLTMYRWGLGPLLECKSRLQLTAKDAVKSVLLSKARQAA